MSSFFAWKCHRKVCQNYSKTCFVRSVECHAIVPVHFAYIAGVQTALVFSRQLLRHNQASQLMFMIRLDPIYTSPPRTLFRACNAMKVVTLATHFAQIVDLTTAPRLLRRLRRHPTAPPQQLRKLSEEMVLNQKQNTSCKDSKCYPVEICWWKRERGPKWVKSASWCSRKQVAMHTNTTILHLSLTSLLPPRSASIY